MKYSLGKTVIVTVLSFAIVYNLIYIISQHDDSLSLTPTSFGWTDSPIVSVNTEFMDKELYLNIQLSTPMSCADLMQMLDIQKVDVRSKTYIPSCIPISKTLLRVVYTESKDT